MEFIIVVIAILIIGIFVALAAAQPSPRSLVRHPTKFGEELRKRAASGEYRQVNQLLMALPRWSVRKALLDSANSLFELQRGLPYASPVGVLEAAVEGLENGIRQSEDFVWSTAHRVAALSNQVSSTRRKSIPLDARRWLDRDVEHLASITQAAKGAQDSLTVAIAAGHGTASSQSREVVLALDKVRRASQQLSQPDAP